jgi:small GTP-binding protein
MCGFATSLRVLTLGPGGAGKTSVLGRLNPDGQARANTPTIGFAVESAEIGSLSLTCWDVGDQATHSPLTRRCFENVDVILFVIDSSSGLQAVSEARSQLVSALSGGIASRSIPVVVAANKQDLPDALTAQKVAAALLLGQPTADEQGLDDLRLRVVETSAVTGQGLEELITALASCASAPATSRGPPESARSKATPRAWMQPRSGCTMQGKPKEEASFLADGADPKKPTSRPWALRIREVF